MLPGLGLLLIFPALPLWTTHTHTHTQTHSLDGKALKVIRSANVCTTEILVRWCRCWVLGLYKAPGKFANNKRGGAMRCRGCGKKKFASICGFPLISALDFYAFMGGQLAISPAIVLRCSAYLKKLPPTSYSRPACDCEGPSLVSFAFKDSRWLA